jgi:hypothetical protein
MFELEGNVLIVSLPEGKTEQELVNQAKQEIKNFKLDGLDLVIDGRITTGICLVLGHELAHICKSVSKYDPKQLTNVLCISH